MNVSYSWKGLDWRGLRKASSPTFLKKPAGRARLDAPNYTKERGTPTLPLLSWVLKKMFIFSLVQSHLKSTIHSTNIYWAKHTLIHKFKRTWDMAKRNAFLPLINAGKPSRSLRELPLLPPGLTDVLLHGSS